jgi:DNA polymerase-3 subunit epsilon
MKSLNTNTKICFIDFETTGIDIFTDSPVEFGAILVDEEGNKIKEFCSRIKLSTNSLYDNDAIAIHGIDYNLLANSPSQSEVLTEFFDKFGYDFSFGAWNVSFDVPFFKKMCVNNDFNSFYNKIGYRHLDVQSISKLAALLNKIDPDIKSLTDCISYFGLSRNAYHNALEDAILCYKVYKKLIAVFST